MKPDTRPIPPELLAELEAIAADTDRTIDTSDIPEVTDFSGFRRGLLRHPELRGAPVRLEPDVAQWFRDHLDRVESVTAEVNTAVREYIARREAA